MGTAAVPLYIQEGHAAPWRPWFAWYPVWVRASEFPYPRERRVWFRWIERRSFYPAAWLHRGPGDPSWPEYREQPSRAGTAPQGETGGRE